MGGKRTGGCLPIETTAQRPHGSEAWSRPEMEAALRRERVGS
jgi:hypothetical protein